MNGDKDFLSSISIEKKRLQVVEWFWWRGRLRKGLKEESESGTYLICNLKSKKISLRNKKRIVQNLKD